MADFDDDEEDQPDPILRLIGPSLVARVRNGEVGVFTSIETHNVILDAIAKANNNQQLQPLKQIFEETKVARARSHKLDRLVNERIQAQERGLAGEDNESNNVPVPREQQQRPQQPQPPSKPEPTETKGEKGAKEVIMGEKLQPSQSAATATISEKRIPSEAAAPKRSQEQSSVEAPISAPSVLPRDLISLTPPEEYRLSDKLREMRATVRVRSQPSVDADVIGKVTPEMTILATGVSSLWFRIQWPLDEDEEESITGWALKETPDGQPLFTAVVYEDVQTEANTPIKPKEVNATTKMNPQPIANQQPPQKEQEQVIPVRAQSQNALETQKTITIPVEDFYKLVNRVQKLEDDLAQLRQLLRSA